MLCITIEAQIINKTAALIKTYNTSVTPNVYKGTLYIFSWTATNYINHSYRGSEV